MKYRRSWKGEEWQAFALQLVQRRHQPQNVQIVPDAVRGDAGIEFITTSGCLYQCYAPEETSDIKKAGSAMKAKAGRDLPKLVKNQQKLDVILSGIVVERWILLTPFLDDKDVVASVRTRGISVRGAGLSFVSPNFEALCHSQDDFEGEIEQLKALSLGPPLQVQHPSVSEIMTAGGTSIGEKIDEKLGRAFGLPASDRQVAVSRSAYVKAYLYRENALEQLRQDHAVLWERAFQSLDAEETRLIAFGAGSSLPAEKLRESTDRIEDSLTKALPMLPVGQITQIALGAVSDWLIRCPLDFLEGG